ncbi:MAG: hypothetical protein U9R47_02995 [Actinomycetota bacterium]|nr:hypothetical protein [Actinomycetota bacterium]
MTTLGKVHRPGTITFIGILLYVKAVIAAVAAFALIFGKDSEVAANAGLTSDNLLYSGIAEAIAAVLLVVAAWYLMSGSNGARIVVTVVVAFRLAVLVWVMLTHHTGGAAGHGIVSALFAVLILWMLYGDQRSDEYFKGQA